MLNPFHVIELDISKMTLDSVAEFGLSKKEALRCKNMWTLGLVLWMFGRKRQPIVDGLEKKFAKRPDIAKSNIAALNAGHAFGETAEMGSSLRRYTIQRAEVPPGLYRTITGSEAMAWGLLAGSQLAGLQMTFGSYPITPASPLLHNLARLKKFGVITFQAEDEIAAVCCAIGAAFAGGLGVTSSSGPGIALKTEAIGLACATELPLIVVNSQRGGPSTGLPTKTEQSDLYQAVYGRNADTPLAVVASATPADCFDTAIEAVRLATKYMTPVIVLTDGYLANAAEPWRIPNFSEDYAPFPVKFRTDPEGFQPFQRDEKTLVRNWAVPGTPGLEHRIGGIERDYNTGNISYQPDNHDRMTHVRADKIKGIANDIPLQNVGVGKDQGPHGRRRLGLDPRADPPGGETADPGWRGGLAYPCPAYLAAAAQSRRAAQEFRPGHRPRDEYGPVRDALARTVYPAGEEPEQGLGPAVQDRRDRARRPRRARQVGVPP